MRSSPFHIADATVWRAVRKPERMQLFEAVRRCGGCSAQQLASRVGMSSRLTHYHLKLLAAAGMLIAGRAKRYRDKGGVFTAAVPCIDIAVDPTDAAQARRARALLEAWSDFTQARGHVARGLHAWQRLERLSPAEQRAVMSHLRAIETVLARAAARRHSTRAIPDATHALTLSMQPLQRSSLPAPTWRLVPTAPRRGTAAPRTG